jgi:DNA-binding HxlR family transcriptional regulator
MADIALNEADRAIVAELREGRVTAAFLTHRIDWSREYLTQRLLRLEEHAIVTNLESVGLYELVETP